MLYGTIKPILLPTFINAEWLLLDMHTNKAFYRNLALDFSIAIKATIGGSFAHVQLFMSMHIVMFLFINAINNIRQTITLFVLKSPTQKLFGNLMD